MVQRRIGIINSFFLRQRGDVSVEVSLKTLVVLGGDVDKRIRESRGHLPGVDVHPKRVVWVILG